MLAPRRFYLDRNLEVARSFGHEYVEFAAPLAQVKLALHGRGALAKDAGVSPEGSGSHRILLTGDAVPFSDPDGFVWAEAARV